MGATLLATNHPMNSDQHGGCTGTALVAWMHCLSYALSAQCLRLEIQDSLFCTPTSVIAPQCYFCYDASWSGLDPFALDYVIDGRAFEPRGVLLALGPSENKGRDRLSASLTSFSLGPEGKKLSARGHLEGHVRAVTRTHLFSGKENASSPIYAFYTKAF
jgi:hypothetical protein